MARPNPEEFATLGQVKAHIRRKRRKQPPQEENFLNIYPMMDMMTILLVFLIAQFAVDASNITQSAELEIPFSSSEVAHIPAMSMVVTTNSISLDVVGETMQEEVLTLRNGELSATQLQGGSNAFLITDLHRALLAHRDLQKEIASLTGRTFKGEVQIVADKRTPFRTLASILYTLGQAEFKAIRFVVLRGN